MTEGYLVSLLPDPEQYLQPYERPLTQDDFVRILRDNEVPIGDEAYEVFEKYSADILNRLLKLDEKVRQRIENLPDRLNLVQFYRRVNGYNRLTRALRVPLEQNWYLGTYRINDWYAFYVNNRKDPDSSDSDSSDDSDDSNDSGGGGVAGVRGFGNRCGYRSEKKIVSLGMNDPAEYVPLFRLKQNQKLYSLHRVTPTDWWIIDLMFVTTDHASRIYLVGLCVNTRFAVGRPVMSRNAYDIIHALQSIMNHEWSQRPPKVVHSDEEMSFQSDVIQTAFWRRYGIEHRTVPRVKANVYPSFMHTRPKEFAQHESMGLVDRLIRTIRDMAYQIHSALTKAEDLQLILYQYNHAMHDSLSKFAGFDVTPLQVHSDPELELRIVREVVQRNRKVICSPGYDLPKGTKVRVFNEKTVLGKRRRIVQPGLYEVLQRTNGIYTIRNTITNETQRISRTKIQPLMTPKEKKPRKEPKKQSYFS